MIAVNALSVIINNYLVLDRLNCKNFIITAAEVRDAIDKLERGKGSCSLGYNPII